MVKSRNTGITRETGQSDLSMAISIIIIQSAKKKVNERFKIVYEHYWNDLQMTESELRAKLHLVELRLYDKEKLITEILKLIKK